MQTTASVLFVLFYSWIALAANFPVTSPNDSGIGTLRDAIALAEQAGGANTVTISDLVTNIALASPIPVGANALQDVSVIGYDSSTLSVTGNNVTSIFRVYAGSTLTLNHLTLKDGVADTLTVFGNGGAIYSDGTVNLVDCRVLNNSASTDGGGIFVEIGGALNVRDSTFVSNVAPAGNGGAIRSRSNATITGSTFSTNAALADGGAIASGDPTASNTTLVVTNSTFFQNGVELGTGGAIFSFGPLLLAFSTFSANFAGEIGRAGAIATLSGASQIKNNILTSSAGPNCVGPFTNLGGNIVADDSCATVATAVTLQNPADNGGLTQTIALDLTNPAVNFATDCTDTGSALVSTDQRGIARPQGTQCDSGAFELLDTIPVITCPGSQSATAPNGATSVVVNYPPATATGVNQPIAINCVPVSGSLFNVGNTTVTCMAVDSTSQSDSCSFVVTVSRLAPHGGSSGHGCSSTATSTPLSSDLILLITLMALFWLRGRVRNESALRRK